MNLRRLAAALARRVLEHFHGAGTRLAAAWPDSG